MLVTDHSEPGWEGQPKTYIYKAYASRVMAVAVTRVDGWCAYIDAIPGHDHDSEWKEVYKHGDKLPKHVARAMFPMYAGIPYAF